MSGLDLIGGGMPLYLDTETLHYVQRLMSNIFLVSKAHIFGVADLVIILIGILTTFFVPIEK